MSKNINYSTNHEVTMLTVKEGEDDSAKAAEVAAKVATEAAIQKRIDDAISGLKSKNEELLGKMKAAADRVKSFDGLDPAKLKEMQDRLDQDEDAKLFAEGKKHEVIDKHTQRMRAAHADELKAKDALVAAEAARADAYKGSVLDNQIRSVTSGLHPKAVEDALLHARNIFSLDAKGNAVQLDSEGRPVLGKDGATPFSPAEWIELQKELKPHWFPMGTSGSGSGASRDASGTGKSIKRADFDRLPVADQGKVAREGVKIID